MILVTGGTGFLGGSLVERLLARGAKHVRVLVRGGSSTKRLVALRSRFQDATIELFEGGLGSRDAAGPALEGVTLIYHLAAAMGGAPADMYLNTVVASRNLLDAIVSKHGEGHAFPRVVLVSSLGVYGVGDRPRGSMVDEATPIDEQPQKRDVYSQTKIRQEKLFADYQRRHGLPLLVVRPGVIFGPGGGALSSRIGIEMFGVMLNLGGDNMLPLSYVENCAEAIAVVGEKGKAGEAYNIHDDDLPTCNAYLAEFRRSVRRMPVVRLPYPGAQLLSRAVTWYHGYSRGQLPAIFTSYKTAASWKGNRFDNAKIKSLGWKQIVPTQVAIQRAMEDLKARGK